MITITKLKEKLDDLSYEEPILSVRVFLDDIALAIRKIKWGLQRAFTGVDDSMTWNLDYYLVEHISRLLTRFKKEYDEDVRGSEDMLDKLEDIEAAFREYNDGYGDYIDYVTKVHGEEAFETDDWVTKYIDECNKKHKELLDRMKQIFDEDFFGGLWT